jgi:hypothetical protein
VLKLQLTEEPDVRFSPHQVVACVAVVCAAALTWPMLGGLDIQSGDFSQEPRIILDQSVRTVITAEQALKPVFGEHVELVDINNPFALPTKGPVQVGSSRMPPPPPFELPEPLPMPIPEK